MKITEDLIKRTKTWLGEDGISFFKNVKKDHGKINAVWSEGGIPHSVHFREGMQVRNFLRGTGLCDDWSCHELDDHWTEVVEKAIEEK